MDAQYFGTILVIASIKAWMGREKSAGDLLTRLSLLDTDAKYHFHNDQHNLPRVA